MKQSPNPSAVLSRSDFCWRRPNTNGQRQKVGQKQRFTSRYSPFYLFFPSTQVNVFWDWNILNIWQHISIVGAWLQ